MICKWQGSTLENITCRRQYGQCKDRPLVLKKLGYRADVVFNGIEVIDALNRRPYDVILMDAEMPEMDGRQATILIRKNFSSEQQPQIIAMTANSAQEIGKNSCP